MLREIIEKMDHPVVSVESNAKLSEAAQLMADRNVGSVLVEEDGEPQGIITDRDIVVRCLAENKDFGTCLVKDIMTDNLHTCSEDDGIYDVVQKMSGEKVRRIAVVDESGKAIGIISFGDLVGLLSEELYDLTRTTTKAQEINKAGFKRKAA